MGVTSSSIFATNQVLKDPSFDNMSLAELYLKDRIHLITDFLSLIGHLPKSRLWRFIVRVLHWSLCRKAPHPFYSFTRKGRYSYAYYISQ
ncbi:hypothetical protein VCRA2119O48_10007 [Vibrio crassostreae]|nr:hypothetical protein VCRA2119O48_10007 [Vibrio crassostreae]CAK3767122.1 hypothetical protein VCRA212O16_130007 [Vibrio crassostreae]